MKKMSSLISLEKEMAKIQEFLHESNSTSQKKVEIMNSRQAQAYKKKEPKELVKKSYQWEGSEIMRQETAKKKKKTVKNLKKSHFASLDAEDAAVGKITVPSAYLSQISSPKTPSQ